MKQSNSQDRTSTTVRSRVFSTIEETKIQPKGKCYFWCQSGFVWLLWGITVLFGALATAVILFTSTHRYYDLYEAMHDNFVTFFLEALPVLWVLTFIVLMVVAAKRLRATKRGYKFSPLWLGGSSVVASVGLGVLFNMAGFGLAFDEALGAYAPMYYSQSEREEELWLQPGEGRLVGVYESGQLAEEGYVVFADVAGQYWEVYTGELFEQDQELLVSGGKVRLLGAPVQGSRFHACGVFPWMMGQMRPLRQMSAERQEFVDKIYQHKDMATERLEALEQEAFGSASADNEPSMRVCAEIAAVRRIGESMQ